MESYTATIITIAPSNPIDYLQDFIKSTFAKLGITITHFHPTIYKLHLAHIKFDFHVKPDDRTIDSIEQKMCADRMINQLMITPVEITHTPGHRWTVTLI